VLQIPSSSRLTAPLGWQSTRIALNVELLHAVEN
jgi:hypothetical protein